MTGWRARTVRVNLRWIAATAYGCVARGNHAVGDHRNHFAAVAEDLDGLFVPIVNFVAQGVGGCFRKMLSKAYDSDG